MGLRKRRQKSDITPVTASNHHDDKVVNKLDSVVVADGGKVRAKNPFKSIPPIPRKAAIVMLAVLIVAGGVATYFALRSNKPVAQTPSCSGTLLHRARDVMEPAKVEELEPITNEIKQVPGYEQNSNCLAILLTYAINKSDAAAAQDYLTKLQAAYPHSKYDTNIARNVKTPDEYKPVVDFLQQQAARYKNVDPVTGTPR